MYTQIHICISYKHSALILFAIFFGRHLREHALQRFGQREPASQSSQIAVPRFGGGLGFRVQLDSNADPKGREDPSKAQDQTTRKMM